MKQIFLIILFLWVNISMSIGQDVTATVTDESISGANDGAIDLVMTGGFGPFVFKWSGPDSYEANTQNISGLKPGQYCVTITDELCGELKLCRIVKKCDPIVAVYTGAECPYNANGFMGIVMSGQLPYTLQWSDGYTTTTNLGVSLRSHLDLGVYCVTVTTASGCSEEICRLVTSPVSPMQISENITHPSCGVNKGIITLGITGGYPPYSYLWSDNETTKDRELEAGNYCVTVTDKYGCTISECYSLNEAINSLEIYLTNIVPVDECSLNTCDGELSVVGSGGTPPYSYLWQGPNGFTSNQPSLTGLCKTGIYKVLVTDAYGCKQVKNFHLCCCNADAHPLPGDPKSEDLCNENITIIITADVNGGTNTSGGMINLNVIGPPSGQYSLVWKKDGQFYSFQEDITNLEPGEYCVEVKTGCKSQSRCFTIVNCDENSMTVSAIINPACASYNVGTISVNVSGGLGPYTYKWSDGDQNMNRNYLMPGSYTVTVRDANYCTTSQTFTIQSEEITQQDIECTRLSYCGTQVVQTQQFPASVVVNPLDCREARIVCGNGYVGPWFSLGTTLEYGPGGPTACLIIERCLNGQIYKFHNGISLTTTVGGFSGSPCPLPFCARVRYCDYPTLGGYDPGSVVPIGSGSLSFNQTTSCQNGGCNVCSNGKAGDLADYFCDGVYFGTSCVYNPCAITGEDPEAKGITESPIEIIKDAAIQQFSKDNQLITNPIQPFSGDNLAERNSELANDSDQSVRRLKVAPNPFIDKISLEIESDVESESKLEVVDAYGKTVYQLLLTLKKGMNLYTISLPETLTPGLYFLKETQKTGLVTTEKLIKQ